MAHRHNALLPPTSTVFPEASPYAGSGGTTTFTRPNGHTETPFYAVVDRYER
jgi:hypothetical protein